jgi:hypothetical protein
MRIPELVIASIEISDGHGKEIFICQKCLSGIIEGFNASGLQVMAIRSKELCKECKPRKRK